MTHRVAWSSPLVVVALALLLGARQDLSAAPPGAKTVVGDPYPLGTCIVSGEKLDSMGKPFVHQFEGREIKFCCKGCLPKFNRSPKKYIAKIDSQVVKDQKPRYPLKTCLVSGKPLDGKGMKTADWVYRNRLIRLCCAGCKGKVRKKPAAYLKKLDAAVVAAQQKSYPLKKCVVSGRALGSMGKPADIVVANRLIRLCCAGCKKKARANALKYVARVDSRSKTKGKGATGTGAD